MNRRSLTTYLLVVPAGLMLLLSGCARMQQPRELGWCTVGGIAAGAAIGARRRLRSRRSQQRG